MTPRRRAGLLLTSLAAAPLLLAGCTGQTGKPAAKAPTLAITPASDSKNVPVSVEIGAKVGDGKVTEVTLTDDKGAKVDGAMRPDGSAWVPGSPLQHKRAYTARVTATGEAGKTATQTATFTTMDEPGQQTRTTLNVENGRTYGVAMPLTVAFDPPVPKEARTDVQRRLFVSTDPPQPGTWSWVEDGSQAYYRAPDFWQPGTKLSVRSALEGLPMGKDRYGDADHTATATVGNRVFLEIDNKTKQISAFVDDKLVRKIPVSLGKPSTPSSSGKMVIMEKFDTTIFDTRGSADPYVVQVEDAQRLTWGGEFIHSAPWSVGSQGYLNVSHGCANVAPEDAEWLMKTTHVGDLVTVTGTEVALDYGNGWTAWNIGWEQFAKGSALPVPADLKPSPSAPGAPSRNPAADGKPSPAPSKRGR